MNKKYKKTLNKIVVVLTLFTLVGGYIFSQISDENDYYAFSSTIVRAAGPDEVIDPYIYNINNDYLIGREKDILERIATAKSNSPEVKKVRNYLAARGAPMASAAEDLVEIAAEYDLPYNLMPAIAVIESGGGKYAYRPYNYAGMGGQGNAMTFSNYREAIEKHAQILRFGYFDKGADTPEEIEKYYCYNCPTWGEKVEYVMQQISHTSY